MITLALIGYAVLLLIALAFTLFAIGFMVVEIEMTGKIKDSWLFVALAITFISSAVHYFPFEIALKG